MGGSSMVDSSFTFYFSLFTFYLNIPIFAMDKPAHWVGQVKTSMDNVRTFGRYSERNNSLVCRYFEH